jgi:hypothetical protein
MLSTAAFWHYLHSSHELSLPLAKDETRAAQLPCELCAIIVHLGMCKDLAGDGWRPHLFTQGWGCGVEEVQKMRHLPA